MMQTKDIPDAPVLVFLLKQNGEWTNWFGDKFENSVTHAMPGVPPKLVLSKMRSMIKRGLVDGCGCGCRGDFVLTTKGQAEAIQALLDEQKGKP